jgi:hypothetical protein
MCVCVCDVSGRETGDYKLGYGQKCNNHTKPPGKLARFAFDCITQSQIRFGIYSDIVYMSQLSVETESTRTLGHLSFLVETESTITL